MHTFLRLELAALLDEPAEGRRLALERAVRLREALADVGEVGDVAFGCHGRCSGSRGGQDG